MSEATVYTKGPEFARGYQAAQSMTAWQAQGGHWAIGAFYQGYAPALEMAGTRREKCVKCLGTGVHFEPGEDGNEAESFPCGVCDGLGYSVEVKDGIAF